MKQFHRMRNQIGINLAELMLALVFMAVIAAFLYPTTSRAYTHIKVTRTKMSMVQLANMLEMYHNDFHRYPDVLESLNAIGINPADLPIDPFHPDDAFFQYFTNRYPYQGSYYAPGQLYGIASYGPDKDGDAQETDEDGVISILPHTSTTFTGESAYDAMVFEIDAQGDTSFDNPYEVKEADGYKHGDILLFGPVEMGHLKERYNENQDTWEDLHWEFVYTGSGLGQ